MYKEIKKYLDLKFSVEYICKKLKVQKSEVWWVINNLKFNGLLTNLRMTKISELLQLPKIDCRKLESLAFNDSYYKTKESVNFSVLEDTTATYYVANISIREPDSTCQNFYAEAFTKSEIIQIIENNLKLLKKEGYFDLGYSASIKISKCDFTYSNRIDNIKYD